MVLPAVAARTSVKGREGKQGLPPFCCPSARTPGAPVAHQGPGPRRASGAAPTGAAGAAGAAGGWS